LHIHPVDNGVILCSSAFAYAPEAPREAYHSDALCWKVYRNIVDGAWRVPGLERLAKKQVGFRAACRPEFDESGLRLGGTRQRHSSSKAESRGGKM
jgi:hypothetical protein